MDRVGRRLATGAIVASLWYLVLALATTFLQQWFAPRSTTVCAHATGLVLLLLAYVYTRNWFGRVFLGWSWRVFLGGAGGVLAVYLGAFAFRRFAGESVEPYMAFLYSGLSPLGVVTFIALVLLLAPMGEELVFRHFAFGALRLGSGAVWVWLAALLPTLVFAFGHRQYVHVSTTLVLICVALVCAVARVVSGGLLVPIALHSLSGATALALREVEMRL